MIPLAKDTREAIGAFAEKVENRSLLFEKMVLAKNWGHETDRFNDANRFNVLRACSDGGALLGEDRESAQAKANSPRASDHVRSEARYKARVAGALANMSVENSDHAKRQAENALEFLSLLEKSYEGRSHTFVGELAGRLLINMAGGVQENAGIALDRCFGLPFVPGSAVKGITRHAALWDISRTRDPEEKKRKLRLALLAFGFIGQDIRNKGDFVWAAGSAALVAEVGKPFTNQDSFKGLLSFLPAYPATPPRLVAEVLTPHPRANIAANPHLHPKPKTEPRPIFFPAVDRGSSFAFAIIQSWLPDGADGAAVLAQAGAWLREAVTVEGVGAKTGAGYGWFTIDPQAEERRRAQMAQMAQAAEAKARTEAEAAAAQAAEEARVAAMTPEQKATEALAQLGQQAFAEFAKSLSDKSEVEQRAFLALIKSSDHREDRKRWKKNKPDIWNPIVETAAKLDIPLE